MKCELHASSEVVGDDYRVRNMFALYSGYVASCVAFGAACRNCV
jgi:hypothetical protein